MNEKNRYFSQLTPNVGNRSVVENSTWKPNKYSPDSSSPRRRLSDAIPKRIIETLLEVEGKREEKSVGLSQIRETLNSHGSNPKTFLYHATVLGAVNIYPSLAR